MNKKFSGTVTRYLDPENRSYETVVFQSSKPVLDSELNLKQDVSLETGLFDTIKSSIPSGFIYGDFLKDSVDFEITGAANTFYFKNKPTALVNGFKIVAEFTDSDVVGENLITLSAPPSSGLRTDLVFMEVWRALLNASPDVENKSSGGRIFRYGNTGITNDSLNYVDDILDPTANIETTKRVQIQYRFRVFDGVDLDTYPNGLGDKNIYGWGAAGSDSTYNFSNMESINGDPGLWRSGNGDPDTSGLDTIDGYTYAIPICAVFRRNTTAFSQTSNHNGGVVYPGPSDRPDGLFSDVISLGDILDMRHGVSLSGWDYSEILERNFNALLDNTLSQHYQNTSAIPGYTNGSKGCNVLHCDEIGISSGGLGGSKIGEHDGVRKRFSDRAIIEHPIVIATPTNDGTPTATWVAGAKLIMDLSSFNPYPYTTLDVASASPAGTVITGVRSAYFDGDGVTTGKVEAQFQLIRDLGTDQVQLWLSDTGEWLGESWDLWLELEVSYPSGCGLTFTPNNDFDSDSFTENDSALRIAAITDFSDFVLPEFVYNNREIQDMYVTTSKTIDVYSLDDVTIILPERFSTIVSVTEDPLGSPVVKTVDEAVANNPDRELTIISGDPLSAPNVLVRVVYTAIRPWKNITGYYHAIYYASKAFQCLGDVELVNASNLSYRALHTSSYIYSLTAGTGTNGTPYPFEVPHIHIPVHKGTHTFNGEHELDSPLDAFTDDFDAASGFLRVDQNIPFIPISEATLQRTISTHVDIEGRSFYPNVPITEYRPAAFGKNLSFPQRHKVFVPVLAELLDDYGFLPKHALVMIIMTRWADFDQENNIRFVDTPSDDTTCAAVYKLKGNLLLNRRN
jgi:hypothetical protein